MVRWISCGLLCCLTSFLWGQEANVSHKSLLTIRVGIHTYANDGVLKADELQRYQELFHELAARTLQNFDRPIYIQAAAGTYADIYDWCKNDMIDFAVVTAGVFAKLQEQTGDRWMYLCTMGQGPARNRFEYGIECIVHRDSRINTLQDIKQYFQAGQLDIFMVGKLSTSGGIFPRAYLKRQGLTLGDTDITFTGSHDNCWKELIRSAELPAATDLSPAASPVAETAPARSPAPTDSRPQREQIAFVWDGAYREAHDELGFPIRRLGLPQLDQQRLPESAVIVRRAFYEADSDFYDRLLVLQEFQQLPDYQDKYQRILDWSREYGAEELNREVGNGWEELADQLRRFQQETGQAPRIALVLAGGGAKCAYQVGVAQVVEAKFREFREREEALRDCHISLVVGTSGGAINALPVAMGTYDSAQGIATIERVWTQLDAREILLPEPAVSVGIGLTISLLYTLAILLLVRLRWGRYRLFARERRASAAIFLFCGIGGAHLVWWTISRSTGWKLPWEYALGNEHLAYVLWALVASAMWLVGILLTALGTVIWLVDHQQRRKGRYLALSAAKAREVIVWLTLLTVVVGTPIMLAAASHFSMSKGLERTIARAARDLINERRVTQGERPVTTTKLGELSQTVLAPNNKLLEKDLIITATVLRDNQQSYAESDVYFYASRRDASGTATQLNVDKRFINLEEPGRRQFLLDAVLGSGAVFPFFPARTLADFPQPGQQLHLVDGSFGHHVPIEAALRWGATHIFIVDPSPQGQLDYRANRSLLANSQVALGHLFEQAQKLDKQAQQMRMEGKRPPQVYRVNPAATKHHISLLSFASVPIQYAIDEAVTSMSAGADRFLRQLNPPYFLPELDTLATRSRQ